jgi:hypothetical protein
VSLASELAISGGDIESVGLVNSRAFLVGGRVGVINLSAIFVFDFFNPLLIDPGPTPEQLASCVELRGGQAQGPILLSGPSRMFVVGSGFNLPFGEVPLPADPVELQRLQLTGVLANGDAIDVSIQRQESKLVLLDSATAPPQGLLCPPMFPAPPLLP